MKKYKFKARKKIMSLNRIFRSDYYDNFNTLFHKIIENPNGYRYTIRYIQIDSIFFFVHHKTVHINVPPNTLVRYGDRDKYFPRDIHTDIYIEIEDPKIQLLYLGEGNIV